MAVATASPGSQSGARELRLPHEERTLALDDERAEVVDLTVAAAEVADLTPATEEAIDLAATSDHAFATVED